MKKNTFLKIYLAIIVLGYAFFFSSSSLFFSGITVEATKINSTLEYKNRFITLLRWEYSESQDLMEVELEIENLAYDGIDDYNFTALFKPSTSDIVIDKVINEENYVVIQIKNIPKNFVDLSLRMAIEDSEENIRLYTNKEEISRVDSLESLTLNEYRINMLEREIAEFENQIIDFENKIDEEIQTILNIQKSIEHDIESKKYSTADEIETINNNIRTKEENIKSRHDTIANLERKIKETESKIANSMLNIEELKK